MIIVGSLDWNWFPFLHEELDPGNLFLCSLVMWIDRQVTGWNVNELKFYPCKNNDCGNVKFLVTILISHDY